MIHRQDGSAVSIQRQTLDVTHVNAIIETLVSALRLTWPEANTVEVEAALVAFYTMIAGGIATYPEASRERRRVLVMDLWMKALCDVIARVGCLTAVEVDRELGRLQPGGSICSSVN